jgi:uncharacterized protein (DUF2237 family)
MSITLDATLATAQSSRSRHPLCKIVSKENVNPIPFVGELLSTATPNEQYPAARVHSTGRLFVAFAVDAGVTVVSTASVVSIVSVVSVVSVLVSVVPSC